MKWLLYLALPIADLLTRRRNADLIVFQPFCQVPKHLGSAFHDCLAMSTKALPAKTAQNMVTGSNSSFSRFQATVIGLLPVHSCHKCVSLHFTGSMVVTNACWTLSVSPAQLHPSILRHFLGHSGIDHQVEHCDSRAIGLRTTGSLQLLMPFLVARTSNSIEVRMRSGGC